MKKYTCFSLQQFVFLVNKRHTPIAVIQHDKTKKNGFVFLCTRKFMSDLNTYKQLKETETKILDKNSNAEEWEAEEIVDLLN